MQNLDYERKWLVKSDHKIMGPFSTEMLEELIFKRQIALIDEVRDMNRRWLYIREIPELKTMVENVRIELDKRADETRALQSSATNSGMTNTETHNSLTKTAEFQKVELTDSSQVFTNVSIEAEDIVFKDIPIPVLEIEKKKTTFQFVSHSDPKIKTEISQNKTKIIYATIAILFLALVSVGGSYFYKKSNQEKFEQSLLTRIRKLTIYGADQKAVESFQKLPENLQIRILPDVLTLLLRLDAEGGINLDETLHLVQKKKLNQLQKSQIELVLFNKKLSLNSVSDAKAHLIAAKDADPDSDLVKENEAILNYVENQNKISTEQFLNLFRTHNKGRYLLGAALNHLKQPLMSDNDMVEKIERYLSTRIEFKKELSLIQIYLMLKNSNLSAAKSFVNDFLNTPLQLSQQFKIPGLIFPQLYKLNKIIPYYEKYKSQLDPKSLALIELHLLLEKPDGYAAQKQYDKIQDLLTVSEKNNTQIAIQSTMNRYAETIAIEKVSAPTELTTASHLALLRLKKENNNPEFLVNAEALKQEKNLISFWAELLRFNENDSEKIKKFLELNTNGADDFVPVIEMKARFD